MRRLHVNSLLLVGCPVQVSESTLRSIKDLMDRQGKRALALPVTLLPCLLLLMGVAKGGC